MAERMLPRILVLLILLSCFAQPPVAAQVAPNAAAVPWCTGTVEECLATAGGELEVMWMDSETNRRLLGEEKKYISYGALQRNTVPCSRRGASYYNCQPGAEANPYARGCSAITHCRS